MVILMVKPTPVLSMTILVFTKDDGDLVGNGPAVSEEVTEQLLDVEDVPPVSVAEVVSVVVEVSVESSSLLHAFKIGIAKEPIPTKPRPLKKSFLFIIIPFTVMVVKIFKRIVKLKFMR
ncbi:hypothetical protein D3C85_1477170 [compost metagenome]